MEAWPGLAVGLLFLLLFVAMLIACRFSPMKSLTKISQISQICDLRYQYFFNVIVSYSHIILVYIIYIFCLYLFGFQHLAISLYYMIG